MHHEDAQRRGCSTGDIETVTSAGGSIEVPVDFLDAPSGTVR